MTQKKLLLSATAAAVLAAFNPAFAGGAAQHGAAEDLSSPSAQTEQSAEQSLPSPEQSAADVSADLESGDTERNDAQSQSPSEISPSAGASSELPSDQNRSVDQDRLTGLDRAHPAN